MLLTLLSFALADDPPAEVPVTVDIRSVASLTRLPTDGLRLGTCAVPTGDPERGVPSGTMVLELKVRRGKVSVSTVTTADPGVVVFGPCFERELGAWTWPVRRDDVRVTVQVGEANGSASSAAP